MEKGGKQCATYRTAPLASRSRDLVSPLERKTHAKQCEFSERRFALAPRRTTSYWFCNMGFRDSIALAVKSMYS